MSKEEYEDKLIEYTTILEETNERWKRALADYQNLQKRLEKDKEVAVQQEKEKVLKELLSVYDGIELGAEQFKQTLIKLGITETNLDLGDRFNKLWGEETDEGIH